MIYGRQIGGVVQNCSNSIINSLGLKQSCTKPSKYRLIGSHNRNTLWLRDMASQTARGKSAATGPTADAPMVLCSEKLGDLVTNYLLICVWRRLPRELMSPVKWSSRAEGPSLSSISQGLHMAHKKARTRIWVYSIPIGKENHIKIPRIPVD